jgi:hypothetical protein
VLAAGLWLALLAADCSTAAQDCPAGQMCAAPGNSSGCLGRGQCEPLPAAAEIELSLPVAKGERLFCTNNALPDPGGDELCASAPLERFSLAFSSPAFEAPHVVVASADGVAYFWAGCASESLTFTAPGTALCNSGWGNHVRIQHTPDLYTDYQHLSAVLIDWGQSVKRGQPIGIEGNTGGSAMAKHIHWSAHRGQALVGGPSIPMSGIRFRGGGTSFANLKCGGRWRTPPDPATAYVSDTEPVAPSDPTRFVFKPFNPDDKSAAGLFARALRSPNGGDAELGQLRALPDAGVNRYWLGAALEELKKNAEAERVLRLQGKRPDLPPIYRQWTDLRLAELAIARGGEAEARALLEKCRATAEQPSDFKDRWDLAWKRAHPKTN